MKNVSIILFTFLTLTGYAQKVKLVEGDIKMLKGEKIINTEFIYDGMSIGKKEQSEADYIARKKNDYNEKEPGRGEKWEKAWYADRKEKFEPQFNELFEKFGKISTKGESKYTLIFKTTRTEPGYNIGPFIGGHMSARIDAEITIVETANPSKVMAKLTITNAPGRDAMGYDYDTGYRIQEAYAKSGKEMGKLISGL